MKKLKTTSLATPAQNPPLPEKSTTQINDTSDNLTNCESSSEKLTTPKSLVPIGLDTGSFEKYMKIAFNAPKLTAQEEWELAEKLKNNNDLEAAQQLVFCNLRYVIAIAQSYQGYGLPLSDLVQEGNVGLMKAVKRYDAEKKVKLMTFATHWIRAEIHEFIIKNWRIIKVATTKAQRKLFFKLRSNKTSLDWMTEQEAKQLSEKLEVSVNDVYHMEDRMTQTDAIFDASSDDNDDSSSQSLAPAQYLQDKTYAPENLVIEKDEAEYQQEKMLQALNKLEPRSKEIIVDRWLSGNKQTLKDLSKKYHISLERVRQIEAKAMQKLKESINE